MKTPVAYYGGKMNLVSEMKPLIPIHKQYGEPFSGGASLFWHKQKSQHEFLNDIDLRVFNFWNQCQNNFPELQSMIQATLHHESEHKKAREILKEGNPGVEMAWAFWVQTQMSFGKGIFKGFAFDNEGSSVKAALNKKNNFKKIIWERLQSVELFNRDALELIRLKDWEETFFYLDPPYEGSDCGHYEELKSVYYPLLEMLPGLKSKWLLSTYRNEKLNELILKHGWNFKEIQQPLAVSSKSNAGKKKIEVLVWNYSFVGQTINLFDH